MKVSELIEILKRLPQDYVVYRASEDSDVDYQLLNEDEVRTDHSLLVDEDSDDEPVYEDICVIGVS
jgi:hypothetical protein